MQIPFVQESLFIEFDEDEIPIGDTELEIEEEEVPEGNTSIKKIKRILAKTGGLHIIFFPLLSSSSLSKRGSFSISEID